MTGTTQLSPSPLTDDIILQWVRAHYHITGNWPTNSSPRADGQPEPNWLAIDGALRYGRRGFPGGSSLAQFLQQHGYARRPEVGNQTPLTIKQILQWADAFLARHGRWPDPHVDRHLPEAPQEHWATIDQSLQLGRRGLPGGDTLKRLLHRFRKRKTRIKCPDITERQIYEWIERHYRETGEWPVRHTGHIRGGYPNDTWNKIDHALSKGARSLRGGSSLAQFREDFFGVTKSMMMAFNCERRWGKSPLPGEPRKLPSP